VSEQLAHILDRLGRAVHSLQYAEGLNPAQWEALRFINRANRYTSKPGALADYLGLTKGTVSQTLKTLEENGYIQRVRDSRDHRVVRLKLTKVGETALLSDPIRHLEAAASEMPEEVETATRLLSRYVLYLQGACGMSAFGMCEDCGYFSANHEQPNQALVCGFTGEPLSDNELKKLCAAFKPFDE